MQDLLGSSILNYTHYVQYISSPETVNVFQI